MKTFDTNFLAMVQSNLANLAVCWAITKQWGYLTTQNTPPSLPVVGAFNITNNSQFDIAGNVNSPLTSYVYAILTGVTGANAGISRQIGTVVGTNTGAPYYRPAINVALFSPFPNTVAVNDTFTVLIPAGPVLGVFGTVTSDSQFTVAGNVNQVASSYIGGLLSGLSGANAGITRSIDNATSTNTGSPYFRPAVAFTLVSPFPNTVADGDTFTVLDASSVATGLRYTSSGVILGTAWDGSIEITTGPLAGTYNPRAGISGSNVKASADMSVDNLDVEGAFPAADDIVTVDITAADVLSGNLANAPVVVFLCDPGNPNDYQDIRGWGWLGDITQDATGHFTSEVRGPSQALQTQIIAQCGDSCDVPKLGYGFCQFPIIANSPTCTVTSVVDRRTFAAVGMGTPTWSYAQGDVLWVTGDNTLYARMVMLDSRDNGGNFLLLEECPFDIEVGDVFVLQPGCKRDLDDCKLFGQVPNFQGPGLYVPSIDLLMSGPNGLPGAGP